MAYKKISAHILQSKFLRLISVVFEYCVDSIFSNPPIVTHLHVRYPQREDYKRVVLSNIERRRQHLQIIFYKTKEVQFKMTTWVSVRETVVTVGRA